MLTISVPKRVKSKGRFFNAIVFKRPSLSFWTCASNNIYFYLDSIQAVVIGAKNSNLSIANALRCSNAVRQMVEAHREETGTVLRELFNDFIIEADIVDKILAGYQSKNGSVSRDDALALYASMFKINYFLSSLNKNFKRFCEQVS